MYLFDEFKPISKAEWLAKIEKDLKGKPISDLMIDFGELEIGAFHHVDDLKTGPMPLPIESGWEIGEDISVKDDFHISNEQLLEALQSGVNAPRLVLNKSISSKQLGILLQGVNLDMASIHFYIRYPEAIPAIVVSHFLAICKERGLKDAQVKASFKWKNFTRFGGEEIHGLLDAVPQRGTGLKVFTINGASSFSESESVTELAQLISEGENLIRQFSTEKFPPSILHQHLQFSLSIGKNYFLQIAKLRALRLLWANIMKAYGIDGDLTPVETHLDPRSQSDDANINMISATTQTMSAIVGGADRVTVLPADAFQGASSSFSRRIARNVQHILQMESYFDRVGDPTAGSYFVEKLTTRLAEEAWKKFANG